MSFLEPSLSILAKPAKTEGSIKLNLTCTPGTEGVRTCILYLHEVSCPSDAGRTGTEQAEDSIASLRSVTCENPSSCGEDSAHGPDTVPGPWRVPVPVQPFTSALSFSPLPLFTPSSSSLSASFNTSYVSHAISGIFSRLLATCPSALAQLRCGCYS
jgi:hypothetical protein